MCNVQYFLSRDNLPKNVLVRIEVQHPDLVHVEPSNISITEGHANTSWNILVKGLNAGHSTLSANVTPNDATE